MVSGQSFTSNKKYRIIDIVNCSTGFFQPSKEIARVEKNIPLSVLLYRITHYLSAKPHLKNFQV